jgi:hypothetical protein
MPSSAETHIPAAINNLDVVNPMVVRPTSDYRGPSRGGRVGLYPPKHEKA